MMMNEAKVIAELRQDVALWKREAADRSQGMIELNLDRAHMGVMISRLREALEPFARLQLPARTEGNAAFYSILHKHILDARSILQEASHD